MVVSIWFNIFPICMIMAAINEYADALTRRKVTFDSTSVNQAIET